MSNRGRLLVGGILVVLVIAVGIVAAATTRRPGGATDPSPEPSAAASIGTAASGTPGVATGSPIVTVDPSDGSASSTTPPRLEPTASPRAAGDPRLAYAEFLLRANEDRSTVDDLNTTLRAAIDLQDRDAVRKASVDILDFVDSERDWLREHPPAECYADAHGAANAMLAAYGTAADAFIAWSNATPGLDALAALEHALEAANDAGDALTAFAQALETTTCP